MTIGAALAWTAVGFVVFKVKQPEASMLLIVFLYCALFIAAACTFAVIGFVARALLMRKKFRLDTQVAVSFRQAVLLAVLVVIALFLSSRGMMNWWVGGIMIFATSVIEGFLISLRMGKRSLEQKKN